MTTPTLADLTRATRLMTKTTTMTRRTAPGLTVGRRSATTAEILWSPIGLHVLGPVVRAVPAAVGSAPEIRAELGTIRPGCPRSVQPARAS